MRGCGEIWEGAYSLRTTDLLHTKFSLVNYHTYKRQCYIFLTVDMRSDWLLHCNLLKRPTKQLPKGQDGRLVSELVPCSMDAVSSESRAPWDAAAGGSGGHWRLPALWPHLNANRHAQAHRLHKQAHWPGRPPEFSYKRGQGKSRALTAVVTRDIRK